MTFLRRRHSIPYAPSPAEVLSPTELARAIRFMQVYRVAAEFGFDYLADAARLVDRMEFVKFERAHGRAES